MILETTVGRDMVRFLLNKKLTIECFYITLTAGIRLNFESLLVIRWGKRYQFNLSLDNSVGLPDLCLKR